jgi:chromosome segregation ATPase
MDKKLKKIKKELSKIEERLESLQREKTDLEHKLSGLEAERKKLIEIQSLQGGAGDSLRSVRTEILQTRERLGEIEEMINILNAKKDEQQEAVNELEAQIVENVRKRFKAQLENRFEALAKEFEELWPIAQAENPFLIPEYFAQEISRLALRSAVKAGELAGDELLKREVTKMT